MKWYSFEQHAASFVLPPFVEKRLELTFEREPLLHLVSADPNENLEDYSNNNDDDCAECFLMPFLRNIFQPPQEKSIFIEAGEYE